MGFAAFLKRILDSEILVSRADDGSLILREQKKMKIRVANTPMYITGIKLDRIGGFSNIRDGEWKKACDYLLVCENKNSCVAIFIELKKTIHGEGQPEEQLRWSLPIYKYLCAIYEIHTGHKFRGTGTKVLNFIIGEKYSEKLDKQPVRPKPGVVQKKIYKGMEVNTYVGPQIAFNLLVRGGRDSGVAA